MKKSSGLKQEFDHTSDFVAPGSHFDPNERKIITKKVQNADDDDFIDRSPDVIPNRKSKDNPQLQSMNSFKIEQNQSSMIMRTQVEDFEDDWRNSSKNNKELSKSHIPTSTTVRDLLFQITYRIRRM